jgi:MoxR-like ATPase
MPALASKALGECPRCLADIKSGDKIESHPSLRNATGRPVMVHVGCRELTPAERAMKTGGRAENGEIAKALELAKNGKPSPKSSPQNSDSSSGSVTLNKLAIQAARISSDLVVQKASEIVGRAMGELLPQLRADMLADIYAKISEEVTKRVNVLFGEVNGAVNELLTHQLGLVRDRLQEDLEKLRERQEKVIVIERDGKRAPLPEGEVYHSAFEEILELASYRYNVFIVGATGSGKTHTAEQVARALGFRFGVMSGSGGTTESEFFGTSYPNITTGEQVYIETEFVNLYENGGLFLIDEADALDPNVFLKLNAALANGYMPLPKRYKNPIARKHPDFVCLIAANTVGQGANREYSGRNKIDEATLDRFRAGFVEMDYDFNVETKYACPDLKIYEVFTLWRERIEKNWIKRILSTRVIADFYRLHLNGWSMDRIADKFTIGWSDKDCENVIGRKRGKQYWAKPG